MAGNIELFPRGRAAIVRERATAWLRTAGSSRILFAVLVRIIATIAQTPAHTCSMHSCTCFLTVYNFPLRARGKFRCSCRARCHDLHRTGLLVQIWSHSLIAGEVRRLVNSGFQGNVMSVEGCVARCRITPLQFTPISVDSEGDDLNSFGPFERLDLEM